MLLLDSHGDGDTGSGLGGGWSNGGGMGGGLGNGGGLGGDGRGDGRDAGWGGMLPPPSTTPAQAPGPDPR